MNVFCSPLVVVSLRLIKPVPSFYNFAHTLLCLPLCLKLMYESAFRKLKFHSQNEHRFIHRWSKLSDKCRINIWSGHLANSNCVGRHVVHIWSIVFVSFTAEFSLFDCDQTSRLNGLARQLREPKSNVIFS